MMVFWISKSLLRLLERNLQCHNRNKAVFQVVFAIPVNVTVVTASAIVMYVGFDVFKAYWVFSTLKLTPYRHFIM